MRKRIGFIVEEEIEKEFVVKQKHYNEFGKVVLEEYTDLTVNLIPKKFKSREIGELFIALGRRLIKENKTIENIDVVKRFGENEINMGKVFDFAFEYDEVGELND